MSEWSRGGSAISTARLVGEPITLSDRGDVQRMHADEEFMRYLSGARSDAETDSYVTRNLAHWNEHGFGIWILRERETGALAGRGGLRHLDVDGTDEVEIGWGLLPRLWRRGLGTEIGRACLRFAREVLHLDSVVATTTADNAGSLGVMRKIGMKFERDVSLHGESLKLFRSKL